MAIIGVSETGSAKTGPAIDVRIDDAGVDTEFPYRLFSLILCPGESVEAELSHWFWRHPGGRY